MQKNVGLSLPRLNCLSVNPLSRDYAVFECILFVKNRHFFQKTSN
jgi:hypothetical protein